MFKSNEWLYGKDVEVKPIPEDVANERIEQLRSHLDVLLETAYTDRDNLRVNDVMKAIKYWEKLKTNKGI